MTIDEEEKYADESDRATALEMQATQAALQEIRNQAQQKQKPGRNGKYKIKDCEECGNEIGLARLKVAINNTVCVECQTAKEKRNQRG